MNQELKQIQTELRKEKTLAKAKAIALTKRVRKTSNPNIWCVQSGNERTTNKFYMVTYDQDIHDFLCSCPAFIYGMTVPCCHSLSIAIKEVRGGYN